MTLYNEKPTVNVLSNKRTLLVFYVVSLTNRVCLENGCRSQDDNLDKNEYFYIALSQTCKNINEREVNDC